MNLNRAGIITTDKRFSWKILKTNLLKNNNVTEKKEIQKCFNVYKIFLVFFYIELLLILTMLYLSAHT